MDNLVKDIIKTITKIIKTNPYWIGGDMNLPDIDWSTTLRELIFAGTNFRGTNFRGN